MADLLDKVIEKTFDKFGVLDTLGSVSKIVSEESLEQICHQLAALHKPMSIDYAQRFGLEPTFISKSPDGTPCCRHCSGVKLTIKHGRYGYYFKCMDCDGNTPIKIGCGNPEHRERIRKQGRNFYRECTECGSSSLYFTNPD